MSIYECRTLPLGRPSVHLISTASSAPFHEDPHEGICTRIDLYSSVKTVSTWKTMYVLASHPWVTYRENSLRNRVVNLLDRWGLFRPCDSLPFETAYITSGDVRVIRDNGRQNANFLIQGLQAYTALQVDENAMWEFERESGRRFAFINMDSSFRASFCDVPDNQNKLSDIFSFLGG